MIEIPEEMQLPVAVAVSSKYRVPARGTIDLTPLTHHSFLFSTCSVSSGRFAWTVDCNWLCCAIQQDCCFGEICRHSRQVHSYQAFHSYQPDNRECPDTCRSSFRKTCKETKGRLKMIVNTCLGKLWKFRLLRKGDFFSNAPSSSIMKVKRMVVHWYGKWILLCYCSLLITFI
jgi:hypothetical protein